MSRPAYKQVPLYEETEEQSLFRDVSLRDIFYLIFRHKRKIMFFVLVGIVAAVAIGAGGEIRYRSEAKLLVKFVRESVSLGQSTKSDEIITGSAWSNVINSELEILQSRELAEKVVDYIDAQGIKKKSRSSAVTESNVLLEAALFVGERVRKISRRVVKLFKGAAPPLSKRERAVLRVGKNLELAVPKKQNIIHVGYVSESPQEAQAVLDQLVALYLDKHMAVHRAEGSYQFFLEQAIRIEQEMADKQELLRHMKNKLQIASLQSRKEKLSEQMAGLRKKSQGRDSSLAATKAGLGVLEKNLADLQKQLSGSKDNPAILPTFMSRTYEDIVELQLREQKLLVTYTEGSAAVQKVRQQIKRLQDALTKSAAEMQQPAAAFSSATEAYTQTLLAMLKQQQVRSSLEAEIRTLNKQLTDTRKEIEVLNEGDVLVGRLQRELGMLQENYQKYFTLAEQARIDQAKESEKIANISVVQAATLPLVPVVSTRLRDSLLIFLFCTACGFALAFITEYYLDHSLRNPLQVEELLGLPTLASVPRLKGKVKRFLLAGHGDKPLLQLQEGEGHRWDLPPVLKNDYDVLCEKLLAITPSADTEPVILGVTSYSGGEGVSTVAANLAVALAGSGKQVILVEANVGHPTSHEVFGESAVPGVSEINVDGLGQTRVLQHNLYLLPATSVEKGSGSNSIVPQRRCEELVKQLQRLDGGYVVVDMPPLNGSAAALRLARKVHNIVLVIEAERNRHEAITRGRELLKSSEANIMGVVLNKRRYHIPTWLYSRC